MAAPLLLNCSILTFPTKLQNIVVKAICKSNLPQSISLNLSKGTFKYKMLNSGYLLVSWEPSSTRWHNHFSHQCNHDKYCVFHSFNYFQVTYYPILFLEDQEHEWISRPGRCYHHSPLNLFIYVFFLLEKKLTKISLIAGIELAGETPLLPKINVCIQERQVV